MANCNAGQLGEMLGWCGNGGGGSGGPHSSAREGEGAVAKKIEIQAIVAQIQSAYGLQEVEGGSVASQGPLPW